MPEENVKLVRWIYAAWARGDWSSVEWASPDIEWVSADGPSAGTQRGVAAMVEAWRDWLSAWRDFRIAMDELLELDDERILALVEATGQGKSSGLELGPMRQKAASLFHIRKGKVTRFVFWWDRERALADLGLASERNR